jgi:hypothetical protein
MLFITCCLFGANLNWQFGEDTNAANTRTNDLPHPPTLIYPYQSAVNVPLDPVFTWELPDDGPPWTKVVFHLGYFDWEQGNIWIYDADLDDSATSYSLNYPLELGTNYIWKVVLIDSEGDESTSAVYDFQTILREVKLPTVVLMTPADDTVGVGIVPKFTWELEDEDDTHFYFFYLEVWEGDELFYEIDLDTDVFEFILPFDLDYETTYTWVVNAYDLPFHTSTNPFTFTTIDEATAGERPLPVIDLTSPENDATIGNVFGDLLFEWTLPANVPERAGLRLIIELDYTESGVTERELWINPVILGANRGFFYL